MSQYSVERKGKSSMLTVTASFWHVQHGFVEFHSVEHDGARRVDRTVDAFPVDQVERIVLVARKSGGD